MLSHTHPGMIKSATKAAPPPPPHLQAPSPQGHQGDWRQIQPLCTRGWESKPPLSPREGSSDITDQKQITPPSGAGTKSLLSYYPGILSQN